MWHKIKRVATIFSITYKLNKPHANNAHRAKKYAQDEAARRDARVAPRRSSAHDVI
jgi:hypothetical protein